MSGQSAAASPLDAPLHGQLGASNLEAVRQAAFTLSSANRGVTIGRDAANNVIVTGDRNDVRVTLIVVDRRLRDDFALPATGQAIENPYRGLDAFYETDAAWFFGRTKLIERAWILFQNLQHGTGPRILAVTGASGSGKSSLVRAGLLPELARQPMEGLKSPRVLVLRPGAAPLSRLAEVLARLPSVVDNIEGQLGKATEVGRFEALHRFATALPDAGQSRLVLVVDQFEELYTECQDAEARSAFLENLAFASSQPDHIVSVVLTLRSDFAGAVQAPGAFANAVRESRLMVQPLDRDELTDAIARPAHLLGHPWPPELVENLVAQAEGRAGTLPLLQFALKRLWPEHLANRLDDATWSSQLIEDFIVQAADVLFEKAGIPEGDTTPEQRIIQRAFLAMVQLGEGTADTRRVAHLSEFVASGEDADRVRTILAPFVAPEARLITTSEQQGQPAYELTHETLIASWGRLRAWLGGVPDKKVSEAIRSDLRLHRRLASAALEWKEGHGGLWRPPELGVLEAYRRHAQADLTNDEKEFSDASAREWRAEQEHERRMRRRVLILWLAVVLTVLGLAGGGYYWWAEHVSSLARNLSQSGIRALSDHDFNSASLLLAKAVALRDNPVDREFLFEARVGASQGAVSPHVSGVLARFSPNGAFLAAIEDNARIVLYRSDGSPTGTTGRDPEVADQAIIGGYIVSVSPTGRFVAYSKKGGGINVWDFAVSRLVGDQERPQSAGAACPSRIGPSSTIRPDHPDAPTSTIAFSQDETHIAFGTRDGYVEVRDLTGHGELRFCAHKGTVHRIAFGQSSDLLATGGADRAVRLWKNGMLDAELGAHEDYVTDIAFNATATTLASAGADGAVRIWDVTTRRMLQILVGHQGIVNTVRFNPNPDLVVSGGQDRTVRLWSLAIGKETTRLQTSSASTLGVTDVAFSSDGRILSVIDSDGAIRQWDIRDTPEGFSLHTSGPIAAVRFHPDGHRVAAAGHSSNILVWDIDRGITTTLPQAHHGVIWTLAFSSKGVLASGGEDGVLRLWDVDRGSQVGSYTDNMGDIYAVAFDPTGELVAAAPYEEGEGGAVRIWNTTTGNLVTKIPQQDESIWSVAFSPDKKFISLGSITDIEVWDVTDPYRPRLHSRQKFEKEDEVYGMGFDRSGGKLATARRTLGLTLWDFPSLDHPRHFPNLQSGGIYDLSFTGSGDLIATANTDDTVRLWSVATGASTALRIHEREVMAVVFDPSGARLVSGSLDGRLQVWNISAIERVSSARAMDLLRQVEDDTCLRIGTGMWEIKDIQFVGCKAGLK
jgi:WD40 repeat protein